MSDLLIVTGPPGAGKSTVARLIAHRFGRSALVEGDVFFGFVVGGYIDPWLSGSHEQNVVVTQATATAAGLYPKGGYMTTFDGMVGPWFLPTFLEYADLEIVQYAVLLPSLEACLARVGDRQGHGFRNAAATEQMHAAFSEADIDPRHVIADVPGDPPAVATEVLRRYEAGTLVYPKGP